jgi:hypothetical protein
MIAGVPRYRFYAYSLKNLMNPVPATIDGGHSDNGFRKRCKTTDDAIRLYTTGCRNLLAINQWKHICNNLLSAEFRLCNAEGNPVNRFPRENDFIQIDIPGPGLETGDGYDWVVIEKIGHEADVAKDTECTFMQVRPASAPVNQKQETAHFFSPDASSTFLVRRSANMVISEIHGRNEKPNTATGNNRDNIRNSFVAGLAIAKFSDAQWKVLCKAFITFNTTYSKKKH